MGPKGINRGNVGRIAERIVSNELEFRGFRVSDLNKEGTAANADLLAAGNERTWQVQVKGCTEDKGWWFGYGHCTESIIAANGTAPMFNRSSSFYTADLVVLVCVKSPKEYSCLVLPTNVAEQAAQLNITREYRAKNRDGSMKKPGPVWIAPEYPPSRGDASRLDSWKVEQALIVPYSDNWDILRNTGR